MAHTLTLQPSSHLLEAQLESKGKFPTVINKNLPLPVLHMTLRMPILIELNCCPAITVQQSGHSSLRHCSAAEQDKLLFERIHPLKCPIHHIVQRMESGLSDCEEQSHMHEARLTLRSYV